LRSLVKKWQSMVEAHVDVKTTDGYLIRLFAIGFTKRRQNQVKKTTYAQTAQLRAIRKKMFEIMTREAVSSNMKLLVEKFNSEAIGLAIQNECKSIYPLDNVLIHKCKVVKFPRVDNQKLMESHGSLEDAGSKIKSDFKEPEIQAEV
ncbi:ribosomal 40S subunit protein S1B, partial [Coemansia furcata]